MLLAGEIDIAPISSIEYARHAPAAPDAAAVRLVRRGGRLDPARDAVPLGRVRSVAVTPESATSVVLTRVLIPRRAAPARGGPEADAKLLIGDAALKSAFEDRRRTTTSAACGSSEPACRWCSPCGPRRAARRRPPRAPGRARRLGAPCALRARAARLRGERALRLTVPRPLLREAPLQLRPTRAGGLLHVPRDGPRRRRAAHVPELRFLSAEPDRVPARTSVASAGARPRRYSTR